MSYKWSVLLGLFCLAILSGCEEEEVLTGENAVQMTGIGVCPGTPMSLSAGSMGTRAFQYDLAQIQEQVRSMPEDRLVKVAERFLLHRDHVPSQLLIRFKESVDERSTSEILQSLGAVELHEFKSKGALLIELKAAVQLADVIAAAQALSRLPQIDYVEANSILKLVAMPNDPQYGDLYGLHNTNNPSADIQAEDAWNTSTGSANVVVAVIDSGVDFTHPDLLPNQYINPNEIAGNGIDDDNNGYIDDVSGWDFVQNDNLPNDDVDHGTHVAGTIGARGNNGIGVVGVNWNVKLVGLRICGTTSCSLSAAVQAVEYATQMGFEFSNNSWGGGGYSQTLKDSIEAAGEAGHLFIAAAGNETNNNDALPFYPAGYELANIISVAATDDDDELALFSNFGASSVDIGAPGVAILSTIPGNSYALFSGTSMASPHVAGAAALLRAIDPLAPISLIKEKLLNGADSIPSLSGKTLTGGRLNLVGAINATADTTPPGEVGDVALVSKHVFHVSYKFPGAGDDENQGKASQYLFRFAEEQAGLAEAPFASAEVKINGMTNEVQAKVTGLPASFSGWIGISAKDSSGNEGPIKAVAVSLLKSVVLYENPADSLAGVSGNWAIETLASGKKVFSDSPNGVYGFDSLSTLYLPSIASHDGEIILQMESYIDVEVFYDVARVSMSQDEGATWTVIDQYSVRGCGFNLLNIDLPKPEASFKLRFEVEGDEILSYDGWKIDNLRVLGVDNAPSLVAFGVGYGETSARFELVANENVRAKIYWGLTPSLGETAGNDFLSTDININISGLVPLTKYYYQLSITDEGGNVETFPVASFVTLPDATAPMISNVAVSEITANQATVTWNTNEEAGSEVQWGLTPDSLTNVVSIPGNKLSHSVLLTGLSANVIHYYRVHSKDAAGIESMSPVGSFLGYDSAPPLLGPVNVSVLSNIAAEVKWTSSENATTKVLLGEAPGTMAVVFDDGGFTSNHIVVLTIAPNKTYYYQVISSDQNGNQSMSTPAQFESWDTQAPTMANFSIDQNSAGEYLFTWTTNETTFGTVEYGTDAAALSEIAAEVGAGKSHLVKLAGILPNTQYFYLVRSRDAGGNEVTSNGFFLGPDTLSPNLSEVLVEIDDVELNVSFRTSEEARFTLEARKISESDAKTVRRVLSSSEFQVVASGDWATEHRLSIDGWERGASYEVRIVSMDRKDNKSTSQNYTFAVALDPESLNLQLANSLPFSSNSAGPSGCSSVHQRKAGAGDVASWFLSWLVLILLFGSIGLRKAMLGFASIALVWASMGTAGQTAPKKNAWKPAPNKKSLYANRGPASVPSSRNTSIAKAARKAPQGSRSETALLLSLFGGASNTASSVEMSGSTMTSGTFKNSQLGLGADLTLVRYLSVGLDSHLALANGANERILGFGGHLAGRYPISLGSLQLIPSLGAGYGINKLDDAGSKNSLNGAYAVAGMGIEVSQLRLIFDFAKSLGGSGKSEGAAGSVEIQDPGFTRLRVGGMIRIIESMYLGGFYVRRAYSMGFNGSTGLANLSLNQNQFMGMIGYEF